MQSITDEHTSSLHQTKLIHASIVSTKKVRLKGTRVNVLKLFCVFTNFTDKQMPLAATQAKILNLF